ncbi:MAG: NTP transferase domain-containing protein, partial [Bacteroidaceae bacterium]
MKALILAAGMASRLRPLTNETPKCLLKIGQRCLLQRSIDALLAGGIDEFVIVTGFLHEKIEDFILTTYPDLNVTFIHNEIFDSTNNIYSLWLARPETEGNNVLLLDSDLLYDPEIIKRIVADNNDNSLTMIKHPLGEEEIKIIVDDKGNIVELNKTCNPANAIGESLGIEKMGRAYTTALYKELDKMMNEEHLENVFYEVA